MTNQPNWERVVNLGDMNPLEYGGFFVMRDTTGVYQPEAEVYEPNEEKGTGGTVYRFILERPRFKTLTEEGKGKGLMSAKLPSSERNKAWYWYNEWFVDKLGEVASFCGLTACQLLRMLFSKSEAERGLAYQSITAYFGYFEFDQYPLELSQAEAEERYSKPLYH